MGRCFYYEFCKQMGRIVCGPCGNVFYSRACIDRHLQEIDCRTLPKDIPPFAKLSGKKT